MLREAEKITTTDRNASYGSPTQNFEDIAAVWNVQFRHLLAHGQSFKPSDVARAMVSMKLVREIASPKYDNWLDMAGYAACGWECVEEEQRQSEQPEVTRLVDDRPFPDLEEVRGP